MTENSVISVLVHPIIIGTSGETVMRALGENGCCATMLPSTVGAEAGKTCVDGGVILSAPRNTRLHDFFYGKRLQRARIFWIDAQLGQKLLRIVHGDVAIDQGDRPLRFPRWRDEKGPLAAGMASNVSHFMRATGLAEDGHCVRIAAKLRDVGAHRISAPEQCPTCRRRRRL